MSSSVLSLLLVAALAGAVVFYLKWRGAARGGARLAAGASAGSRRQLQSMQSEDNPEWARSIAEAFLTSLDEIESLRRRAKDRELFQALLDEIGNGFLIVNRDMEIGFSNQAIAGCFPGAGSGGADRRLIEVVQDHRLVDVVRRALQEQNRQSAVIQDGGIRSDGEKKSDRIFEVEAAPLPDHAEAGCWVMIRDITERVVTEQVRKDFVANASHELRTPLTLINGYIETLEDGLLEDGEAAKRSLAIMKKHGRRLVRIIEDMLSISKLEGGATPLRMEAFDVAECVRDVAANLASVIEQKKATVDLDLPEGGCEMVGDRFYWDQIFMNLIENALKQNQRAGLKVKVSFRRDGDNHIIKVTDDGVGIARADLPYIFKRFYRGAKHHAQEVPGTGLGLSIVKRAVEAHGGRIRAASTPGVETVFTLEVPAREARVGAATVAE